MCVKYESNIMNSYAILQLRTYSGGSTINIKYNQNKGEIHPSVMIEYIKREGHQFGSIVDDT